MRKSIAFLTLAAMAMTLGGCGGSEPAEKKAEAPKKKGGKPHENPWAIETQGAGAEAAKPAAKPEKKKGKEGEKSNPWAKDNPTPPSED